MIRALVAIMLFAAALTMPANAQLPLLGYGPGSFGGGGGATPCTGQGALTFNVACSLVYAGH